MTVRITNNRTHRTAAAGDGEIVAAAVSRLGPSLVALSAHRPGKRARPAHEMPALTMPSIDQEKYGEWTNEHGDSTTICRAPDDDSPPA